MFDATLIDILYFSSFLTDISDLNLPKTCNTNFPDPDDLLNFKLIICPDEGFYKGGRFAFNFKVNAKMISIPFFLVLCLCRTNRKFDVQVGPNYPHEPPKVKCETLVYHPNIDLEGNVCLNILREDWKPVLTINSIVYGLQYLFSVSASVSPRKVATKTFRMINNPYILMILPQTKINENNVNLFSSSGT